MELPRFSFAFQPIVHASSGQVWSHEALIRGIGGEPAWQVLSGLDEPRLHRLDAIGRGKAIDLALQLGLTSRLNLNFLPRSLVEEEDMLEAMFLAAQRHGLPLLPPVPATAGAERGDDKEKDAEDEAPGPLAAMPGRWAVGRWSREAGFERHQGLLLRRGAGRSGRALFLRRIAFTHAQSRCVPLSMDARIAGRGSGGGPGGLALGASPGFDAPQAAAGLRRGGKRRRERPAGGASPSFPHAGSSGHRWWT